MTSVFWPPFSDVVFHLLIYLLIFFFPVKVIEALRVLQVEPLKVGPSGGARR